MTVEALTTNGFQVFRIGEDLGLRSDISELEGMVKGALDSGQENVAISFSPGSHLYSNTIAVLIRCISQAEEKGVRLTLVIPNDSIMSSVMVVGLVSLVATVRSEGDLGR